MDKTLKRALLSLIVYIYLVFLNVGTSHEYWKNFKNVWNNNRAYLVLGSVACLILAEKQYI